MSEQRTIPVIGQLLRHMTMSGVFYCPSELSEPWGLEIPAMEHCLWFHVVLSGSCNVEVDGAAPFEARAGDLVLVPHGAGHRAWGTEPAPTPSVFDLAHDEESDRFAVLRHGGGGARTEVVCGGVCFDHPTARHVIEALPPVLHIERAGGTRSAWLHATLALLGDELRDVRPGGEAVVSRLCDLIVIQAVRDWIEYDPAARSGWLGALHDDRIGPAIAAVHDDPCRDWSVASLAAEASMSRSAFAARFSELVGEPAMAYVTRWRMHRALELLTGGDRTVAVVGRDVGYESEAAFSRAFKRVMGIAPSQVRRAA